MKVKHWMTEVLLDVTSEEITKIAHSVYDKAKAQALKGRFCLSCQKGHSALVHGKFQFWKKTFCLLEQTCWKRVCFCLGGCIDEVNQSSSCCCWSAFCNFLHLCQFLFFHLKLWSGVFFGKHHWWWSQFFFAAHICIGTGQEGEQIYFWLVFIMKECKYFDMQDTHKKILLHPCMFAVGERERECSLFVLVAIIIIIIDVFFVILSEMWTYRKWPYRRWYCFAKGKKNGGGVGAATIIHTWLFWVFSASWEKEAAACCSESTLSLRHTCVMSVSFLPCATIPLSSPGLFHQLLFKRKRPPLISLIITH